MTSSGFANLQNDAVLSPPGSTSFKALTSEVRASFASGKTKDLGWRRQQLEAVQRLVEECHEEITAAVRADLGGPKIRGVGEFAGVHLAAAEALANLGKWTSAQSVSTPLTVSPTKMASSYVRQEPKGVVLIIGPWNFPTELVLHPLVSALAAGNCVVVKPSEVAVHSANLLQRLIDKYLDTSCIKVVQGAIAETTALLSLRWDHIFYTGNAHVGRIVLKAAAEHLTPVTLELGGKSPVIVDKSATMKSVIERIAFPKFSLNAGQICVAPDYVLIHKDREQEFIDGMKQHVEKLFGKDAKQSPHFGRIINSRHVSRICNLLKESRGEIMFGGSDSVDTDAHYIPPTLVRNVQLGEPLLTEEIFGPVLPIITTDSVEDAVNKVNCICDQPLALYIYAEDKRVIEYVLSHTASGGAAINTSAEHLMNTNLPFGGVGSSGHGSYHGKAGFDEFTHRRAVLHQDTLIMQGASLPPKPSDMLHDLVVKATITGFLSKNQKKCLRICLRAAAVALFGLAVQSKLFYLSAVLLAFFVKFLNPIP